MFKVDHLVATDEAFVATISAPKLSTGEWAKMIHDLNASTRTLSLCLDELSRGYHFDDAMAALKIEALRKAANQIIANQAILLELAKRCSESAVVKNI